MTKRLQLFDISKTYPGVIANDAITLEVGAGEIHAILGENGAGKSTLMKIIYGVASPDSGQIHYEGKELGVHNPAQARQLGIEMVYQHFSLFETATVAENVALCLPGRLDLYDLREKISETAQHYGLNVEPDRLIVDLSVGEKQQVEILRCLLQHPKLLILDEPTSVLSPQAIDQLFAVLRRIASEGCSIVFISHKLDEVKALCHTATVLRNGKVTGNADPRKTSKHDMAVMMVGADLPVTEMPVSRKSAQPVLKVRGLSAQPLGISGRTLTDVNFDVFGGEVVGIAGVSGNGQSELAACLSGEALVGPDTVFLNNTPAGQLRPDRRRRLGLAYVPEERLGRGAVPPHSLQQNSVLTGYTSGLVRHGFVKLREAKAVAASIVERFSVKANGTDAPASSLSGGNLQKYIIGRELSLQPQLFIAAQPTWGIDVGAAAFIRQAIVDLSRKGTGVLIFSEELEELFEICDRIYVLSGGRISPSIPRAEATKQKLGSYMTSTDLPDGELQRERAGVLAD